VFVALGLVASGSVPLLRPKLASSARLPSGGLGCGGLLSALLPARGFRVFAFERGVLCLLSCLFLVLCTGVVTALQVGFRMLIPKLAGTKARFSSILVVPSLLAVCLWASALMVRLACWAIGGLKILGYGKLAFGPMCRCMLKFLLSSFSKAGGVKLTSGAHL